MALAVGDANWAVIVVSPAAEATGHPLRENQRKRRRNRTFAMQRAQRNNIQVSTGISVRTVTNILSIRNSTQFSHNIFLDYTLRSPRSPRCEKCGLDLSENEENPESDAEDQRAGPAAHDIRASIPALGVVDQVRFGGFLLDAKLGYIHMKINVSPLSPLCPIAMTHLVFFTEPLLAADWSVRLHWVPCPIF